MFEVVFGEYRVLCEDGGLPLLYNEYRQRAALVEEFHLKEAEGSFCFFGVGSEASWPSLVVAQRYAGGGGFHPGALIVPETAVAFLGAGERLLAYSLREPRRLWEDYADVGFSAWSRHGDVVLAACELELAAWSTEARKLWSAQVEPPWDFQVEGDRLLLDIMGEKSEFPVLHGPGPAA